MCVTPRPGLKNEERSLYPPVKTGGYRCCAPLGRCVTGTLQRFKRTEIEEVIERNGGKASSSVSSKTSFVLVGELPGSKLDKAKKLGVRIVSEAEFLEMIRK